MSFFTNRYDKSQEKPIDYFCTQPYMFFIKRDISSIMHWTTFQISLFALSRELEITVYVLQIDYVYTETNNTSM